MGEATMSWKTGGCHCGAVRFSVESHTPYPFMRCYCSICRKTAGTGGFAINLMGANDTFKVKGRRHVGVYQAVIDGAPSEARRLGSPPQSCCAQT